MADEIEIKIPDIGGATEVDVIEIMVKVGDEIKKDSPLITLESDKASMEIPSPQEGKVSSIKVKVGDKVSEGDLILSLISTQADKTKFLSEDTPKQTTEKLENQSPNTQNKTAEKSALSQILDVYIPDIGGATDVDVIEIMVKPGQTVEKDEALITLEGDKATMDIPAPFGGTVENITVNVGDKVSEGSLILSIKTIESLSSAVDSTISNKNESEPQSESIPIKERISAPEQPSKAEKTLSIPISNLTLSAGPAVRRLARELGVNLEEVKGTGRKSRITKEDVQLFVKTRLNEKPSASGFSLPRAAAVDFSKFGPIESKPLNKIKRLTGINVHRSWITIPHVTQFDEADISELEQFRTDENEKAKKTGLKLTILAFVTKIVAKALATYPQFNASLDVDGENLIYKNYFHIGIAVETPNGLVVPVLKNVDQLSIFEIAQEMTRLSLKARDKGLMPADMSGGCFTISSLGGIGGTAFTPIVNSPEVAILGLSRSTIKPVYEKGEFKPRLMLPLSLSYDHRVIDGAEAARFTRFISESLSDIRRILL